MLQPLRPVRKGRVLIACPSGETKPIPRSGSERERALCKMKPIWPTSTGAGGNGQDRRRNWLRFCMPVLRMVHSKSFSVQGLRSFRPAANWVCFTRLSHLKRDVSHSHSLRLGSFRTIRPAGYCCGPTVVASRVTPEGKENHISRRAAEPQGRRRCCESDLAILCTASASRRQSIPAAAGGFARPLVFRDTVCFAQRRTNGRSRASH